MQRVIAKVMNGFESFLGLAILIAFFYPTPIRDAWVWLFYGYPLIWGVRVLLRQSIGFNSLVIFWAGVFIALCVLNFYVAPYPSRGMILLYRPLWGIALMVMLVGWVQRSGSLKALYWSSGILASLTAIAALTATTWEGKASRFVGLTQYLPNTRAFPVWEGGFNPNEIAGVMTWFAPLLFAIAMRGQSAWGWRAVCFIGFGAMFAALFLGQSLSGLIGVGVGLVIAFSPKRVFPWLVGMVVLGILVANAVIFIAPTTSAEFLAEISGRPKVTSLEHRGVMWERGVNMLRDHPWTGVGIALYRQLRVEYPTQGFENALVPHPHNEALHFATDLGLPGLLVWLMLYVSTGLSLYTAWKRVELRPWVIALTAAILAHAVYGLTDAIPVWDRLAFVGWWMFGLCAALAVKAQKDAHQDKRSTG